jgi:hypothetical protein
VKSQKGPIAEDASTREVYARRQFETFGRAFREPDAPFLNCRQMDSAESAGSFEESEFQ